MIEESYENQPAAEKSEIIESKPKIEIPEKHQNESMIERIVVEKYRMLDRAKNSDPKSLTEFGFSYINLRGYKSYNKRSV